MKISLKLKYTDLLALANFVEATIHTDEATSKHDALLTVLMTKFYKKLKEKTILLEPRKYNIDVPVEQALAFVLYYQGFNISITTHEGNLVRKLLAEFDQQTSNMHK